MDALAVFTELRSLVEELQVAGDRIRYRPADRVTPELREQIRLHKDELLRILGERDPLPLPGDPRRPALELIDDAWAAGCRVVIAGGAAHVEAREHGAAVPGALRERLRVLERGVVEALTRQPWREQGAPANLPGMGPRLLP